MYQRIRDLREDHDLTQREMAQILHCSQQVYSNYELGQRDIPTAVLIALAKYYKTTTRRKTKKGRTESDPFCPLVCFTAASYPQRFYVLLHLFVHPQAVADLADRHILHLA